jgi:hypothetical protein
VGKVWSRVGKWFVAGRECDDLIVNTCTALEIYSREIKMAHGGKRPGAGRKPGAATKLNEAARLAVYESGLTPLDFMLRVLRDEGQDQATRMDAAKAAAPYVHAKLASIDSKVETSGSQEMVFKTVYETPPT